MTDYLPPTGFKHAPSPALDYARLPPREKDVALLEQVQKEADRSKKGKDAAKDDQVDTKRTSIGPFGECVPTSNIEGSDLHRVQFYADNDALKIPMVSPIFDKKDLRGLPRLLVVRKKPCI